MREELLQAASGKKKIAIAGHVRPDGDCVGSCLGAYHFLKKHFPEAEVQVFLEEIPHIFEFLKDWELIKRPGDSDEIYDRLDEHGFYRLPTSFDIRDYDIMDAFVDTLSGTRREKLLTAISGRGAFGNFKNQIRALGIQQQWYDFQAAVYKRKAIEWCEENELEWEE